MYCPLLNTSYISCLVLMLWRSIPSLFSPLHMFFYCLSLFFQFFPSLSIFICSILIFSFPFLPLSLFVFSSLPHLRILCLIFPVLPLAFLSSAHVPRFPFFSHYLSTFPSSRVLCLSSNPLLTFLPSILSHLFPPFLHLSTFFFLSVPSLFLPQFLLHTLLFILHLSFACIPSSLFFSPPPTCFY